MPRVTDIRAIVQGSALDVRVADGRACLDVATRTGIVRILLPADGFLRGARGPRDGNGKLFPAYTDSERRTAVAAQLEADAAQVPASTRGQGSDVRGQMTSPKGGRVRKMLSPEDITWMNAQFPLGRTDKEIAGDLGVSNSCVWGYRRSWQARTTSPLSTTQP